METAAVITARNACPAARRLVSRAGISFVALMLIPPMIANAQTVKLSAAIEIPPTAESSSLPQPGATQVPESQKGVESASEPKRIRTRTEKKAPTKRGLDLTVRNLQQGAASIDSQRGYSSTGQSVVFRKHPPGLDSGPSAAGNSAGDTSIPYRTEPLFQSRQTVQILEKEVPVTVKVGRWKTDQTKALGLSATVPLKLPTPVE